MSNDVVLRARSLLGCRFRPQGRVPSLGLDCIGLVCAAFGIPAKDVPRDYQLQGGSVERLEGELRRFFRRLPPKAADVGDVLILRVEAQQLHLAIVTERGIVHADARIGHVVETVGRPPWPIHSVHRRRTRKA